ncbi:MAG TPA: methionine--tRNA ligase subunit beta [Candidatus Yanofskybacteria bacterium]|uniref:Methionine--tRNA ligase n=1 Tax=Candidatus Yanofskybacteria bacterium GW2011_GWE2_40_11 TaxID=1619033 RepID=A0A0G0QK24_9BACT|nr:MAG: Methionine-tRNA ligase [Candidatus Yanofskybacteria bacterium GW2011_GWE1_40_10]KKR40709.1 MAG: Methionine-tRNA ligase [Candidatus Yanofskybacteria bacterium GW2011_GWE2_40_11]HAU07800.1 methionine--tRNA ligase subunit beta [Candidatus Yanofskybacteria bacterium]HBX58090.1 methionine--tRNA ligase subunit beta [Candidatus Yanofskybacteria bacterium]
MITIDDFKKIELKVAKVLEAERVEGSDKLIKLQLQLGEEKRQILGGIGKHYEPDQLVGRQIIIVANLEPRQMMGLESQGMLLAASDENGIALLMPDKEVTSGSKIN